MSDQNITPLATVGAAFAAWAPNGLLPASFLLLQDNQRWQEAMAGGKGWLEANNTDALKSLLAEVLDGPQSACLYANLAVLLVAEDSDDGRKLLDELSEVLLIENRDARDLTRSMEHLTGSDTIHEREEWVLCAAALLALSAADGKESKEESNYLVQFVPEPAVINDARKLLAEINTDAIMEKVSRMAGRQRKFLAANLFALMFADSEWHAEEQELVEKFAKKLFVMRSELEGLLKATYTMFNLSVFE